jgi:hypothetical protein
MAIELSVPTERAERSEITVNHALAHFREQAAGDTVLTATRMSRTRYVSDFSRQDAIVRMVSIAEDFTIGSLFDTTRRLLPQTPPFVAKLWDQEFARVSRSWSDRLRAWRDYHGIRVKVEFPDAQRLEAFIQVRNAVTHGLGGLSPDQLTSRNKVVGILRTGGVHIDGDRIDLTDSDVERCAETVRQLVSWLDDASRRL